MIVYILLPYVLLAISPHTAKAQVRGDIELRGSDPPVPRAGRLYIYDGTRWGTVCDNGFDKKDGAVACHMLGYDRGPLLFNLAVNSIGAFTGTEPVMIAGLACDGNENKITECQITTQDWGNTNCNHDEDVALFCLGDLMVTQPTTVTTTIGTTTTTAPPRIPNCTPSPLVQLVNGSNEAVGRVQIRPGGTDVFGEICDDFWDQPDAKVICRMLCFNPDNARAYIGGHSDTSFGNRTGPWRTKNLNCNGNELSIYDCETYNFNNNCTDIEAAAVSCLEAAPTPPPLPTPEIECSGFTEHIKAAFRKDWEPDLKPEHLNLTNTAVSSSCVILTEENNTHVTISIPFYDCNTVRTYNFSHIIYTNDITYYIPPPAGDLITRRVSYDIAVSCAMGRNGDPDNDFEPIKRTASPQEGSGHPRLEITLYCCSSFRDQDKIAELPAQIFLDTVTFVGMELITKDPFLKVVLQQCYATPSASPDSTPQYSLIFDKCAVDPTIQFYAMSNVLYGFSFTSFKFFGDGVNVVYLHCKGIVCGLDEFYGRCDRTCGTGIDTPFRKKRSLVDGSDIGSPYESLMRRDRREAFEPYTVEADSGPIYLVDPTDNKLTHSSSNTNVHTTMKMITPTVKPGDLERYPTTGELRIPLTTDQPAPIGELPIPLTTNQPSPTRELQMQSTTAKPLALVNDISQISQTNILKCSLPTVLSIIIIATFIVSYY